MVFRRVSIFIIAFLVVASSVFASSSQAADTFLYERTGHWVTGEFLNYYHSVDDPDRIFGGPITEVLPDPLRPNIQVQYFERVRMDYDPTRPVGQRVRLADLGSWMYRGSESGTPVNIPVNSPLCKLFPKNNKYVCFGFLQLYERYHGQELFGEPVSDVELVNDRLVQYFERVRMEWRNEMPVNQKVVLTEIGRINFDNRVGNPELLKPVNAPNLPVTPALSSFVARPLLAANNQQVVFVIVRDQYGKPIPDAQVEITIVYSDQRQDNIRVNQPTNLDGFTVANFQVNDVQPNQVIDVKVKAVTPAGAIANGATWFRIWW
jgi:hypothetical protein